MSEASDRYSPTIEKETLEIEKLRIEIAQLNEKSERDQLESQKTSLEIRDLQRPWYRKPQYVLAALPTALAIVGIIIGFYTGFFREKIANLQQDLATYEKQKAQLVDDAKKGQEELGLLNDRITQLNNEKHKASDELDQITKDKNELLREQNMLDREVGLLNTDLNQNQNELKRAQAEYVTLGEKRKELEGRVGLLEKDVLNADINGLTELWLGNGERIKDEWNRDPAGKAREQIVKRFIEDPLKQKQYVTFYETYLSRQGIQPLQYVSVLCLLVEVTRDERWRKELANVTQNFIRVTTMDPSTHNMITLQSDPVGPWDVLNKISSRADRFPDKSEREYLYSEVADALENSRIVNANAYSVLELFFLGVESLKLPLHRSNPRLFLKIVRLGCDFDEDQGSHWLLRRIAPSALVAEIARRLLTRQNYQLDDYEFDFLDKSRHAPGLEPPTDRTPERWKEWANRPDIKRLVKVWLEEKDFRTLLADTDFLDREKSGLSW